MRMTIPSILATSLLLSACGGGDSAIDGAKDIPNRFGNTQNALDDFSSGSTGDSGRSVDDLRFLSFLLRPDWEEDRERVGWAAMERMCKQYLARSITVTRWSSL